MIFLIAFCVLSIFALPSVMYSDGVDFAMSVAVLGNAHPPSYPAYVQLVSLAKYLPVGNAMFKVSLCGILITSLIVYGIFKFLRTSGLPEKLLLSITILFATTFFMNALSGEVYSLSVLIFLTIYFLSEKIGNKKIFFLISFLMGIGIGVHQSLLFMLPFIIVCIIENQENYCIRDHSAGAFFFLMGASSYLYLPLRANASPAWNWGNPATLKLFLNSFFRKDFESGGLARPAEIWFEQIKTFNPVPEMGLVMTLFCVASVVYLLVKKRKYVSKALLLVFFFSYFIIILLGYDRLTADQRIVVYPVFFVPAYAIMAVLAAEFLAVFNKRTKIALCVLLTVTILYNVKDLAWDMTDYNNRFHSFDRASEELLTLPRNAILIVEGSEQDFPAMYLQKTCRMREDVRIISLAFLGKQWNLKDSLEAGTAYSPVLADERDMNKQILRNVILFQRDFKGKRVFTTIEDKEQLPEGIKTEQFGRVKEFADKKAVSSYERKRI